MGNGKELFFINGDMFQMPSAQLTQVLKMIYGKVEPGTIYAISTEGYTEAHNDVFKDRDKLLAAVEEWRSKGFFVGFKDITE